MLVNRYSISKLAITSLESKLWCCSAYVKESLIVYWLVVRSSSIGTKNFASLYVGVHVADKVGVKDRRPSVKSFWNLAEFKVLNLKGLNPCIAQWTFRFFFSKIFKNICSEWQLFYLYQLLYYIFVLNIDF